MSLKVDAGAFHALLGENGAGKSTLVKCVMGYYAADAGQVLLERPRGRDPQPARGARAGIGMVYQHFTLVPNMTVAENLVLARGDVPAVIDWASERAALEDFIATHAFPRAARHARGRPRGRREAEARDPQAALLEPKLLILDEPTSVLTPDEADEVSGPAAAAWPRPAR